MKSLKNLLNKKEYAKKITLTDKDIFFIFQKVIKEEFGNIGANKLQADYFKGGTIFVRSGSSAWGGELFTNRNSIIKKINKELGEGMIKEIKLKNN